MRLASIALLVREYDEAIRYFVDILGFSLAEDTDWGQGKRWVRVSPPSGGSDLLLAKAINNVQAAGIGKAGGGRVSFLLHTSNFEREYSLLAARGVAFVEEPRNEPYGWVVVFEDLYGNKWDLVGLTEDALIDGA
jgi:catechol 2,3-dioxygenase-like lactoylglutathione lyase family enzyme